MTRLHSTKAPFGLTALGHAALWLCATLALPSWAQQAPANELDSVVVTGSTRAVRLQDAPYAASVVDAPALRAAGPMINLSEGLARVPGLVVNNRNNYAQDLQISSRGFGARATFGVRGLRLFTDGIPATMPDGQGQVGHFDLANAQRIEVIRGPFTALYGNSSGGVIALFSAPITEPFFESGVDVGSHGLYQARLSGGAPISDTLAMSASASAMYSDGFRDHSAANRNLANGKAVWILERDKVVVSVSHVDQFAQDPLGLSRSQLDANPRQTDPGANTFNTRKALSQDQVGSSWNHRFTPSGPLAESQVSAYAGTRSVTQFQSTPVASQSPARSGGGVVAFDRLYQGLDGRLTWRWSQFELVTGLNAEDQMDDRHGYENFTGSGVGQLLGVQGRERRNEANAARTREAYAQGEWTFAPDWSATAGLRSGQVSMSTKDRYIVANNGDDSGNLRFHYNTPVLGLRWKTSPTLTLHAAAGLGFESPTLGELAYRTGTAGGFNTDLKAQSSRHSELGAKWKPTQAFALDASVFNVATSNEIGVLSNASGRSVFQNVGHTQRQGAELNGQWRIAPTWRSTLALTYLDATYRDTFATCTGTPCTAATAAAGNRIAGTQKLNAWAELAWQAIPGGEAGVEWQARSRTAVNDINSDFAQGWGVVNLRWLQRWSVGSKDSTVELLGRIDNVADHRYAGSVVVNDANGRYFEPAAGRSALVSLRYLKGF